MKITNTQPGPRGINTVNGPVLVDAGQTVEAKVYAREQEHIEAAGWFTIDGDYEDDPDKPQSSSDNASRDENGDTPEMAELRRMFDTAYERQGKDLAAAKDEVTALQGTVTDLQNKLATKDTEIATLKTGAAKPATIGPEAKHRGAGSYSIMEGDAEVREKLTKDQAEAFNALDADGKAKWLADNPKPAA